MSKSTDTIAYSQRTQRHLLDRVQEYADDHEMSRTQAINELISAGLDKTHALEQRILRVIGHHCEDD